MFASSTCSATPCCEDNYSAAELVLQEAMYAGVPPVVLPYGGARRLVESTAERGWWPPARTTTPRAVERLHRSPATRRRLGEAAREHARRTWSPERLAPRWRDAYSSLLKLPKRPRSGRPFQAIAGVPASSRGAARFADTLGDRAPQFRLSLTASRLEEVLDAERSIAASTPALASADAGGVLHYRRRHPQDAHLRLWSGLVLLGQGRPALAAGEFSRAIELGLDHWRASWYLARAAQALGQPALAEQALQRVPASVTAGGDDLTMTPEL